MNAGAVWTGAGQPPVLPELPLLDEDDVEPLPLLLEPLLLAEDDVDPALPLLPLVAPEPLEPELLAVPLLLELADDALLLFELASAGQRCASSPGLTQ